MIVINRADTIKQYNNKRLEVLYLDIIIKIIDYIIKDR